MNSHPTDSFLRDLEQTLQKPEQVGKQSGETDEYGQVMALAQRLAQMDPSQESSSRGKLRARLLQRAAARERAGSQPPTQRPLWQWLRWGFSAAAMLGLVAGLIWIFSNLRPGKLAPAGPAAAASATPLDAPSPTPIPPLSLETPIEEVLARMTAARWGALWLDGTATLSEVVGEPQTTFFQAWLDRAGRGRALSSDPLPGDPSILAQPAPRWVWVSDGSAYALFDLQNGQYDPSSGLFGWASHPLENAGEWTQLLFPYYLTGRGGVFSIAGEAMATGRPALIVDWQPALERPVQDHFWVDCDSGLLLRRQSVLEDGTIVRDLQVRTLVIDLPLPDSLAGAGGLEASQFAADPELVQVPELFIPLPTPVQPLEPTPPPANVDSHLLEISAQALDWQDGDPSSGDLYLNLRIFGQEPDQLLRLDDACLDAESTPQTGCAGVLVDLPALAWSPLFWAPDGSQAVFIDSNNTRLMLLDAASGLWRTLLEPAPVTTEVVAWAPSGLWLAVTLQAGDNGESSLVHLVSLDPTQPAITLPVAADLGGTQLPIGFVDNRLLFLQYQDIPKGQVGQRTEPALYQYDIASGIWSPLALDLAPSSIVAYPVLLSGDSRKMIFTSGTANSLALYDFASGEVQTLPFAGENPLWSPDGEQVALVRYVDGLYELHVTRLDGSQDLKVFEWASTPLAAWSPDGQYLALEVGPVGDEPGASIFIVSLASGQVRRLSLSGILAGSFELRHPSYRP